ncbi:hypothetical protein GJE22_00765 [Enorma sp. HF-1365]|uniref:Uncharacterized protein n=1 Tax=Enorma shizhengliae TaxID=2606615 RepID=A0A7K0G6Q0_9ACTN|nr:hypothetical protein [Enorma shizhengliae]MRX79150.1 hypothetical protein [Enorma shizhengliae]
MKEKPDDKRMHERNDERRLLADTLKRKQKSGGFVDEMSLESRRRSIAYGRARGNA